VYWGTLKLKLRVGNKGRIRERRGVEKEKMHQKMRNRRKDKVSD
jgi:hypothetical protein